MKFDQLQWLINSISSNYTCQQCGKKIKQKDINILEIDWNAAWLEITCHNCSFKSYLKSEVVSIDLRQYLKPDQLEDFKNTLAKEAWLLSNDDIKALWKDLKKENLNAKDLFL